MLNVPQVEVGLMCIYHLAVDRADSVREQKLERLIQCNMDIPRIQSAETNSKRMD